MTSRRDKGEGKDMGGTAKISRNRTMEEGMAQKQWKEGYDVMRMKQKAVTGIYNPKSGEREYFPRHRGVQKDMYGRKYNAR